MTSVLNMKRFFFLPYSLDNRGLELLTGRSHCMRYYKVYRRIYNICIILLAQITCKYYAILCNRLDTAGLAVSRDPEVSPHSRSTGMTALTICLMKSIWWLSNHLTQKDCGDFAKSRPFPLFMADGSRIIVTSATLLSSSLAAHLVSLVFYRFYSNF